MKSEPPSSGEEDESARREALFAEWEGREPPNRPLPAVSATSQDEREDPADAAAFVPSRRSAFPPSFLALVAAGLAFLALEPTTDLRYTLFGATTVIDLGEPGSYRFARAKTDSPVRIAAFSYADRGTYSHNFSDYEVFALTSLPVIVRRAPSPRPPPGTAELYRGEGRLILLGDEEDASFLDRLVNPSARFTAVRQQFQAVGELPLDKPCWLLLDGDLPRARLTTILLPFMLWASSLFFFSRAWRAHRERRTRTRNRMERI